MTIATGATKTPDNRTTFHDYLNEQLKNPEFKKEYDALKPWADKVQKDIDKDPEHQYFIVTLKDLIDILFKVADYMQHKDKVDDKQFEYTINKVTLALQLVQSKCCTSINDKDPDA